MTEKHYSATCTLKADPRTRGIKKTIYEIAEKFNICASVDSDTYCTGGWIFKEYRTEYTIRFWGDKENVKKALDAVRDSSISYNKKINSIEADTEW